MLTREAFTLIELLVVIAIIAVLAAILFPVFARARAKARQIACLSNERQIALATSCYTTDYDATMPIVEASEGMPDANRSDIRYTWRWALYPYVRNVQVFHCPDSQTTEPWSWGIEEVEFPCSYIAVAFLVPSLNSTACWSHCIPAYGRHQIITLSAIATPAETGLLLGCPRRHSAAWVDWGAKWVDPNSGASVPDALRSAIVHHNDGINLPFCDGHTKWVTLETASTRPLWSIADD